MTAELVGALCLLAGCYCLGGLSGLYLAWSQPARMLRWAAAVERVQQRINEIEERGERR